MDTFIWVQKINLGIHRLDRQTIAHQMWDLRLGAFDRMDPVAEAPPLQHETYTWFN